MLTCICGWQGEATDLQTVELLHSVVEGCPVCGRAAQEEPRGSGYRTYEAPYKPPVFKPPLRDLPVPPPVRLLHVGIDAPYPAIPVEAGIGSLADTPFGPHKVVNITRTVDTSTGFESISLELKPHHG